MQEECQICPRLVEYRRSIAPKKPLLDGVYWNKPVPTFGAPDPWLLIVGLAPGAHGANRTGRPFQGDAAGILLYGALSDVDLASSPGGEGRWQEIELRGVRIANICRCVPPENKPTSAEITACSRYLAQDLSSKTVTDLLCIGKNAYDQVCKLVGVRDNPSFSHGVSFEAGHRWIHGIYHTSRYNQNTGRITKESVVQCLRRILSRRQAIPVI